MGAFKLSWLLCFFVLSALVAMFMAQITFMLELLYGHCSWVVELRGDTGSGMTLAYILLLLNTLISLSFTVYMVLTLLRPSTNTTGSRASDHGFEKNDLDLPELEELSSEEATLVKDQAVEEKNDPGNSLAASVSHVPASIMDTIGVEFEIAAACCAPQTGPLGQFESLEFGVCSAVNFNKALHSASRLRKKDVSMIDVAAASGFSQAGRHQFASILDVFWGMFFDLHGKLTPKAQNLRLGLFFGLDAETMRTYSIPSTNFRSPLQRSTSNVFSSFSGQRGALFLARDTQSDNSLGLTPRGPENSGANVDMAHGTSVQDRDGSGSPDIFYVENPSEAGLKFKDVPPAEVAEASFGGSNPGAADFQSHAPGWLFHLNSPWTQLPYEQNCCRVSIDGSGTDSEFDPAEECYPGAESEAKLLNSFRACIMKIIRLQGVGWLFRKNGGSDEELMYYIAETESAKNGVDIGWLFRKNGGSDEELIYYIAETESAKNGVDITNPVNQIVDAGFENYTPIPLCGDKCIWQSSLIISFGVWCVRQILELSLVESRPELWGKYTSVLNCFQGILTPAFIKVRTVLKPCECLQLPEAFLLGFQEIQNLSNWQCTNTGSILDLVNKVQTAISRRKGTAGTPAGDIAFPMGKRNLVSVLKRYRRRLKQW